MDQAVGLRQEEIQVLQQRRVRRKSKMSCFRWKKGAAAVCLVFGWCSLTEASSPDSTPGFLLRSRCSSVLEYSSLEHRA